MTTILHDNENTGGTESLFHSYQEEYMNTSEVARLRERIVSEYQASQRVFTGFTPTAQHTYITQREAHITQCFESLKQHIGFAGAFAALQQAENEAYSLPSSGGVQ
jgi:hypothetical protein